VQTSRIPHQIGQVARSRLQVGRPSGINPFRGLSVQSQTELVKHIRLSPQRLNSVPTSVSNRFFAAIMNSETNSWLEKFGPNISTIEDPVLRGILMLKTIQLTEGSNWKSATSSLEKYLEEVLADRKHEQNIDAHLFLAGLTSELAKWNKTHKILSKLQRLPLSDDQRLLVDGATVALSTETGEAEGEIVKSAVAAARRLMRTNLKLNDLFQLQLFFQSLGQNPETAEIAVRIDAWKRVPIHRPRSLTARGLTSSQTSSANSRATPLSGFGSGGSNEKGLLRLVSAGTVKKLIEDGKKDEAVRIVAEIWR